MQISKRFSYREILNENQNEHTFLPEMLSVAVLVAVNGEF